MTRPKLLLHFCVASVVCVAPSSLVNAQAFNSSLETLTRVDQIRRLSPEQAAKGYPVRIRGVITMDAPAPDFFIQDSTAGIYVEGSASPRYLHVLGDMVELEGVTGPGKFAPVIREIDLRLIGRGELPQSHLLPFSQLANGQQDSQWVQVRGIVRSAAVDRTSWREMALALVVASEGGEFNVRVPINHEQDFSSWVDSEVLIEGVCGSLFTADRQLSGILFYVPRLSFIRMEAPAPEVPISALLKFSPGAGQPHRVRVRGVVEYQEPGHAIFLHVQGKGLRVLTHQAAALEIGDVVDVLGFPAMGDSAPILEDAVFRRLERETPPSPVKLDLTQPWEQFDGALVSTEAKLLSRQAQDDGLRFLLQNGDVIFEATLPRAGFNEPLSSVPVNSTLRVTGICLVRSGGLWRLPESFRMLLRSPADMVVINMPSWWNLRHTLWVLGITVGVLLVVMAWVVLLGKRLREQMALIRQKLRHSAVLEERNRIARELHDTLEQELAGITMQLDLATDCFQQAPRIAKQALDTARDMSRHSMIEARRSVWDLRCQLLEDGDLVSAMSQITEPLSREDADVRVNIVGTPVRLSGQIEMNLLRIGQEAVANAVKHGHARHVDIELHYAPESVRLTVKDDGSGFDPSASLRAGHFGLPDMRERAQSMKSRLEVESEPGMGTHVTVNVPLVSAQATNAQLKNNSYSRS